MKFLVVHEVNYLSKIIYEFQILPEILSMLGHEVTIIDYDDTWKNAGPGSAQWSTRVHQGVHRAYPRASVTVRRPGMIRFPILSRISGAVAAGAEIYQWLSKNRVDAILLYGVPTVGIQTLLAAKRYRIPIMFRSIDVLHHLVPSSVLVKPTRMLERFLYKRVNAISCVTLHLKDYVQSCGAPESRVRVLPSGVDSDMFSPGPRNPSLLARWGIGPNDKVLLFMGTIYGFSGLDRVIRDFPRLLARHPRTKLLIVGLGEDENRLKRIAAESGLSDKVIFGGLQPYALLPDIIRSSDICINPFELNGITRDILPTKLFQYLACGKPLVATALPGTLPFLEGERHGVVYVSLNDFVQSVADLLDDGDRQAHLGRVGAETSRSNYDWKRIAETMAAWMGDMAVEVGAG